MKIIVDSMNVKKKSERIEISYNDCDYADLLYGEVNLSLVGGKVGNIYFDAKQTINVDHLSPELTKKIINVMNEIESELNEN